MEGLLEVVDDGKYHDWYTFEEPVGESQTLGAAALKLRSPSEVRTNGAENKLVSERSVISLSGQITLLPSVGWEMDTDQGAVAVIFGWKVNHI